MELIEGRYSIKCQDPIVIITDDHMLYVDEFKYIKGDNIVFLYNNGAIVAPLNIMIHRLNLKYNHLKTKYYCIGIKHIIKEFKGETTMVTKKNTEVAIDQVSEDKTQLAVLDIGSFNIKVAGSNEIYENRFITDNDCEKHGSETLDYNGNTYVFGKGKFDLTYGKAFKNIEVPLLYALGKEKIHGNVNLILHLPTSQMANKPMLLEKLQGQTFEYGVNGAKSNSVTFKTVGVLKEGFSSFYALAKRNKGMIAIVDIGGRTIDIFLFIDGVLVEEISIPIGTMDYFTEIANHLTVATGEKHELEDIHPLIQHEVIDLIDHEDITNKIFNDVKNALKIKMDKLNNYQIHLCGGGAEYFEKNFKATYDRVTMMDNNLTSNVDGAENIGKAKGLDK